MSRPQVLSDWTRELSIRMPHLSKPQVAVLAVLSYGMVVLQKCSYTTIALWLAMLEGRKFGTVRQQLREWYYDAQDKRGAHRRQIDVQACFAPLLRWVVQLWTGTTMALALDATALSDRFVVLSISVLYRSTGIPVAWTVLDAHRKGGWKGHWLRMLEQIRPSVPSEWTVLVLGDRGLYARWLFRHIVRMGWHPFLRIHQQAKFRPEGQSHWYWLTDLVNQTGGLWYGSGTAFSSKDNHLRCTLVAWWGEGHKEAWFILTDLSGAKCEATWYGLRAWCEQGFKCLKRGGWQWQHTRMTDPARVARMWLTLAVATLWTVTLGSQVENGPTPEWPNLPDLRPLLGGVIAGVRPRRTRLVRLGWLWLNAQLSKIYPPPLPRQLVPEPWPGPPEGRWPLAHPPPMQKTYP
jgi:hypothetical protein